MTPAPSPTTPTSFLRRLQAWWAHLLEVPSDAPLRLWLWRLLVRPAVPGDSIWASLASGTYRLLGAVAWLLTSSIKLTARLLYAAAWPVRLAMRWLDKLAPHINVTASGRLADRYLGPVLALPGARWIALGLGTLAAILVMTTPFTWFGQTLFMVLAWALAMVLRRLPGQYPTLMLATLSLLAMGRYAWWRLTSSLEFESPMEYLLGYGLLLAEAYTWLVVVFGFIQTAWPLQRPTAPLVGTPQEWPSVDVFIPTYNEPLSVVRATVLAALALDWPADKLNVFILDDGKREEFREFAESVGVRHITRTNNRHAKAGNLNHALEITHGELIAIFDCDHIPTESFLTSAVGWFQHDPKCAMLQTPHHFFSPDPFERNLGTFRRVPNEGALFYGLIQDGNDFWNATFFCGSCAVIRRAPLMEVGGIAVETVTEDAHTALKLHRRGYTTAYMNRTLAAGLATESLSAHVGQRIRWARGMAQIFRTDNPFLGKGLTLWQRICYSNAMLHFFFGLPRLVFLTAPMAFLFFEWHIINAGAILIALYVFPYILQSNIANAHVQGEYRHSFWAEVYETVLAWYVAWPTTVALINPRIGTFNVTAKGGLVAQPYFDWGISRPYTILVLLNFLAFGVGLGRLFFWNTHETATVLLNLLWTAYSILILGAALGVAAESRQVRRMHRVNTRMPATLFLDDGQVLRAQCVDFSMTGVGLHMAAGTPLVAGQKVHLGLWRGQTECVFPATVALQRHSGEVGLEFDPLDTQQQIDLVQCTFARKDVWRDWNESHDTDRPLQGLQEIAELGVRGYRTFGHTLATDARNFLTRLMPRSRTL